MNQLPSIFDGLSEMDVNVALRHFQRIEVGAHQQLISEGDVDPSLAIVESGELEVLTGDTRLAYVRPGEMVGEMALFSDGIRTASVRSITPTRLLLLDVDGFARLRSFFHPIVVAIEEAALTTLTERLRTVSNRISQLAEGTAAEHVTPPQGFFDRVASAFGSGGFVVPGRVDAVGVLRSGPLFAGFDDEVLALVAKEFSPIGFRRGHFVITEGEPGNEMYIVASGLIEVVVAAKGDKVEPLAALEAGEAFGMCALVQERHTRMASCIAREKSVCLQMDRIKFAEVIHRADGVGSAMRVAMIRALIDQLAYANGQLALLELKKSGFGALLKAGAGVEAHGSYLNRPD
ncbi:MAG: cyclic nucleotide-binding domain-containing protein [Myxococcales bacterium]|nr:cyclic nucleotide-binding domain-containing protein [Myxococcales bacterium]MCB9672427.1 cyclic nucleotide-binding domain-containing protein [Alphaproteobacteria bacterium]MCB9693066.1 cyclic nucleotide-binding domain-containing protein [Alphaproteobacteria bacterium]